MTDSERRHTGVRAVAFTTDAAGVRVLPQNPRRIGLWLGAPNANRGNYSFGAVPATDAGVYMNSLSPGTWVWRKDIGNVICQELWHTASGATNCGVLEVVDCSCQDTDDMS